MTFCLTMTEFRVYLADSSRHPFLSISVSRNVSIELIVREYLGFELASRCTDRLLSPVFGNTFLGLEENKKKT